MSQHTPHPPSQAGYDQHYPQQYALHPKNGLGTAALVLGILAILVAFVPILGFFAYPLAILGIVFGLISVRRVTKRVATNRGVSVAGLVTSLIGFILVIVSTVVYVGAVNAAVSGAAGPSSGSSGSPCTAAYPDKQASDICADAKGTVTLNGMEVTSTPLTTVHDDLGANALCSTVTIRNASNKTQDYNVLDFKLQTPSGVVASTSLMGAGETLDSGALIAGGTKTGKVCGDSTTEKGQFVLIYKPNAFEATRGIWLFTV